MRKTAGLLHEKLQNSAGLGLRVEEVIDLERDSSEQKLREKIEALAFSRSNDAVKLAFLGEDALKQIGHLDLSALTELHRLSNGTVEMKFIDRVKLLELLEQIVARRPDAGAAELLSAIDSAADRLPRVPEGEQDALS